MNSYLHLWVPPTKAPTKEEPMAVVTISASTTPEVPPEPQIISTLSMSRLQQALQRKAEEEAREPLAAIAKLQEDLVAFSEHVKQQASDRALATMLKALGEEVPTPTDSKVVHEKLRTSLVALLTIIGEADPFA